MPIKKRSKSAREKVSADLGRSTEEERAEGRSSTLQGLHLDVYRFVRDNPNCTRDDVSRGIGLKTSTCTARIKELIDEGYLFEPPGVRKPNPSGVKVRVLHVTERPEGGQPLENVRIELDLTIDCNGTYGARARVVNGHPQTGIAHVIRTRQITVKAPHPDTYRSVLDDGTVAKVSRMELTEHAEDIIDADYKVLKD